MCFGGLALEGGLNFLGGYFQHQAYSGFYTLVSAPKSQNALQMPCVEQLMRTLVTLWPLSYTIYSYKIHYFTL